MITPIYTNSIYNTNRYKPYNQPTFMAHPDFKKLEQYFSVKASSYFRRGQDFGTPADEFIDVENTLREVFRKEPDKQKSMLIVGIGTSQEPFSNIAVTKDIIKDKPIKSCLDLYTVDLQSKPNPEELFIHSFSDSPHYPKYAGSSFVYDATNEGLFTNCHYRVKDELFNFLKETYDNPEKSKWETRIQDVAKKYPNEKFDVISANNILPYIGAQQDIINTILELKRALKPSGYLITDPFKFMYMYNGKITENMSEIRPGIYKKIK